MGTASEAVQGADGEGGVRVTFVRGGLIVVRVAMMCVKMHVALAVMFVFVRVDVVLERAAQSPDADSKKHHADDAIAKRGEQINR